MRNAFAGQNAYLMRGEIKRFIEISADFFCDQRGVLRQLNQYFPAVSQTRHRQSAIQVSPARTQRSTAAAPPFSARDLQRHDPGCRSLL
jgi:hypothetical protein